MLLAQAGPVGRTQQRQRLSAHRREGVVAHATGWASPHEGHRGRHQVVQPDCGLLQTAAQHAAHRVQRRTAVEGCHLRQPLAGSSVQVLPASVRHAQHRRMARVIGRKRATARQQHQPAPRLALGGTAQHVQHVGQHVGQHHAAQAGGRQLQRQR